MKAIAAAVVVTAWMLVATPASACSCGEPGTPKNALASAGAVFTGEVIRVETIPSWRLNEPPKMPNDLVEQVDDHLFFRNARVTIAVDHAWKGVSREEIVIYTAVDCCTCGYQFNVGQKYVVYAYWSPAAKSFSTSICSRTKPLHEAKEDLSALGTPQYDFTTKRPKAPTH